MCFQWRKRKIWPRISLIYEKMQEEEEEEEEQLLSGFVEREAVAVLAVDVDHAM